MELGGGTGKLWQRTEQGIQGKKKTHKVYSAPRTHTWNSAFSCLGTRKWRRACFSDSCCLRGETAMHLTPTLTGHWRWMLPEGSSSLELLMCCVQGQPGLTCPGKQLPRNRVVAADHRTGVTDVKGYGRHQQCLLRVEGMVSAQAPSGKKQLVPIPSRISNPSPILFIISSGVRLTLWPR